MNRRKVTWQETFLLCAERMSLPEAVEKAGVGWDELRETRHRDPAFEAALRRARERGGQLPQEPVEIVLDSLRAGASLWDAVAESGITWSTFQARRRDEPLFEVAVLNAVIQGRGSLGQIRPMTPSSDVG